MLATRKIATALVIGLVAPAFAEDPPKETLTVNELTWYYPFEFELGQEGSGRGNWKIGHSDSGPGGQGVIELVPMGQDIESWSELVSILVLPRKAARKNMGKVEDLVDRLRAMDEEKCPGAVTYRTISQSDNSVTYEWWSLSCADDKDQHELARFIDGKDYRYRVAYVVSPPMMQEEVRADILKSLAATCVRGKRVGKDVECRF